MKSPPDQRDRTAFGSRLLAARGAAGLTQTAVCKALGISQSTLSELERHANGSAYTASLAALYRVDGHYLATGSGSIAPAVGSRTDEMLRRLPGDMAALLPQDAETFGAQLIQLCERIHERAEQVRKHATTLQAVKPELPEDIEDLKRELDALGPAERKIAYARAMNIISSPPLRPERIRRNRHHAPAPPAAAAPKSKPKVRR